LTEVNSARKRARKAGTGLTCIKFSTLLGFALGLLLRLAQRHGLLERLANFVQALFIEVVDPACTFGTEVDQVVVLAHGGLGKLTAVLQ